MRRLYRPTDISRAVQHVPITRVLRMCGVDVELSLPSPGTTQKIFCPYSYLHPDGGREKEARLYSDNKVFCHVCRVQYDSVSLAAMKWDCSQKESAKRLLAGITEMPEAEIMSNAYTIRAGAIAALAVWADAHEVDRFSPEYAQCVRIADGIMLPEHVYQWLDASKNFLTGRTVL